MKTLAELVAEVMRADPHVARVIQEAIAVNEQRRADRKKTREQFNPPMTDEEFATAYPGPRLRHETARRALRKLRRHIPGPLSPEAKAEIAELEDEILDCAGGTS